MKGGLNILVVVFVGVFARELEGNLSRALRESEPAPEGGVESRE